MEIIQDQQEFITLHHHQYKLSEQPPVENADLLYSNTGQPTGQLNQGEQQIEETEQRDPRQRVPA